MAQLTVALVSPGAMGAAIGGRMALHGVRVVTPAGRSAASRQRAEAAGIAIVPEAELASADFLFSVVPPGVALATAQRLAPHLRKNGPVFVDWNAVSPARVEQIAAIVQQTGARFVDGSIIGNPGAVDAPGPSMVTSGPDAALLAPLGKQGLRLKPLQRQVGAASALKMSYSGITKGFTSLGAAMLLAAERAGCAKDLLEELSRSQPGMLTTLQRSVPDMFSKAARFAPEMEEIADFIGPDRKQAGIYQAIASFYAGLGDDYNAERCDVDLLERLMATG